VVVCHSFYNLSLLGDPAYSVVDLELSNRLSDLVCRDPAKPFLTDRELFQGGISRRLVASETGLGTLYLMLSILSMPLVTS
jgi:hypothetical protein